VIRPLVLTANGESYWE